MTATEKARSVVEALEAEINHSGAGAALFEVLPIARALVELVEDAMDIAEIDVTDPAWLRHVVAQLRQALKRVEEA